MSRYYFSWKEQDAYKQGKRDEERNRRNYDYDKHSDNCLDIAYWQGRRDEEEEQRRRDEEQQLQEEIENRERQRKEEEEQRRLYEEHQREFEEEERRYYESLNYREEPNEPPYDLFMSDDMEIQEE